MSVKLSELLEAWASSLSLEAGEFSDFGADDYAQQSADEAKALRAIAPALVEFVAASESLRTLPDPNNTFDTHDNKLIRHRDAWNRLFEVMKEAGVTCE